MREIEEKSPLWLLAFPLMILMIIVAAWMFRDPLLSIFSSAQSLRATILATGRWAPLAFIALQIVQVVVFFIPGEVVQIAGGYIFGTAAGSALSIVGIALGSVVNLAMARVLGRHFVIALLSREKLEKFDAFCTAPRAEAAFFLLFVIPGIPKDTLCFIAGLTSMRLWLFLAISMLGRLPGIVGSAFIGSAAERGSFGLAVGTAAAASFLFLLGLIFQNRVHAWVERHFIHPRS